MGRPKGGHNRKWLKDEKIRIIQRYLDEGKSSRELGQEEQVDPAMLRRWVRTFLVKGESAFEAKGKGNHFAALHTSKSLSEKDRLKLIIMKQEIEIERLKKGYMVKGDGASKEFVTTSVESLKSSNR